MKTLHSLGICLAEPDPIFTALKAAKLKELLHGLPLESLDEDSQCLMVSRATHLAEDDRDRESRRLVLLEMGATEAIAESASRSREGFILQRGWLTHHAQFGNLPTSTLLTAIPPYPRTHS